MSVASRRGGKTPPCGIGGGLSIEALEGHGGVEGLQCRQIEIIEHLLPDPGPEAVKGVGGNGHATAFPDRGDHLGGRSSLHEREGCSKAEEVPVGGGDLHSRNDQESVDRQTVSTDQSLAGQILHRIAGIVVGDRYPAQPLVLCRLHHHLGGIAGIRRVVGVQVEVEGVRHTGPMIFGEQSLPAKHPETGRRNFLFPF